MFDSIFPKHWTTLQRLMWLKTNALARAVYEIVTGNPVTFTAKAAPLKQLSVAFSPVQEGTGDPSPDNVRPISGWSSLTVYHSGSDTSNPQTISISLGSTVYSGTVDVVTGGSGDTGKRIVVDENTPIAFYGGGFYLLTAWSDALYTANADVDKLAALTMCDTLKYDVSISSGTGFRFTRRNNAFVPLMLVDGVTSKAEAQAWLADHNVAFFYPLATSIPFSIDPQTINSLAGDNTMWSNTNGNLTVEYRSN